MRITWILAECCVENNKISRETILTTANSFEELQNYCKELERYQEPFQTLLKQAQWQSCGLYQRLPVFNYNGRQVYLAASKLKVIEERA